MEQIQELYYALGELCYAIAKADGVIQKEEKDRLHSILETEFRGRRGGFETTEIIFQILQREGMDSKTAYDWAIREIKLNSQYVSETLKKHFISVINNVATSFPPGSIEERKLIDDFIRELNNIQGDPVFSHLTEDNLAVQKSGKK
jgi:uncharacterized tellurite resistance protein B-like protein